MSPLRVARRSAGGEPPRRPGRPGGPGAFAGAAAAGLVLTAVADRVLRRSPPGGPATWTRTNHAGDQVTLLEGPALALGATAATVTAALAGRTVRGGPAAVVAGLGSAAFGLLDDLRGDGGSKGLRGHLAALRAGRLTTGAVKVLGLGATGLLAAALADRGSRGTAATLVGGAVVAGSANLANLFDLRPGRALKVTLLAALPLGIPSTGERAGSRAWTTWGPAAGTAGAVAGAALACLPADLAGRAMLGDTGANPAGALVGLAAVQRMGLPGRLVTLGLLVALTLASERVSFTAVIESTPVLRELDALGRPPRR